MGGERAGGRSACALAPTPHPPSSLLSAFLNNTPIVALLIPLVRGWARRNGVPAKQLLIPLR